MVRKGNQNRKKSYMKYKAEGHLEINKKKKQERHEKRLKKFADKRAAGKSYVYNKERAAKKTCEERLNKSLKTEPARYRSLFAKLDNELKAEREEEKKKIINNNVNNIKLKKNKKNEEEYGE